MKKKSFFSQNPYVLYTKDIIFPNQPSVYVLLHLRVQKWNFPPNFRNGIIWTAPFPLNIRNGIIWRVAFSKAFRSSEALISVLYLMIIGWTNFQVFLPSFVVITINFISVKKIAWSLQQSSYTIVTKNTSSVWVSRLGNLQLIHSSCLHQRD